MKLRSLSGLLLLFALVAPQIGCLQNDSGSESGTEVDIIPPPDPNTYVCNPLNGDSTDGQGPRTQGVASELYYLDDSMPRYGRVGDYIDFGNKVDDIILFFNQIFIPTRPFDRGFTTYGGETIQSANGDTLYEYFALKMSGRVQLGSLPEGAYQFALLADDGANFYMDFGQGLELVVDDDGTHPTKMGCGNYPVVISANDKIPYQLEYYQGPRYHSGLILMARPWPADGNWNDIECGRSGNARYFDSTQDPPVPQAAYLGMQSRGWQPLAPDNYLLPEEYVQNPCNAAAPVMSGVSILGFTSTDVTIQWQTDIPSDSKKFYRLLSDTEYMVGPFDSAPVTQHQMSITGLLPNTDYRIVVRSTSASGLSSDSAVLSIRTRR